MRSSCLTKPRSELAAIRSNLVGGQNGGKDRENLSIFKSIMPVIILDFSRMSKGV